MSEHLDVFLRSHTVKIRESTSPPTTRKVAKDKTDKWTEHVLVFDTETRTTVDQTLMFVIWRLCKLVDGQYLCEREGIAYVDHLEKIELDAIKTFIEDILPDVEIKSFPPKMKLEVHQSLPAFMNKVFWPAVRQGSLIVGFNLPFDLSRISRGWRRSRKRGFSFIMGHRFWRRTQCWIPDPYRPEIRIEAKDAKTSFISRGKTKLPKQWPRPGRFLDLGALLFSLFDKHLSLNNWCEHFKIEGKLDHTPSGRISQEELAYCRQDVKATQNLLNAAKREFDRHPLTSLRPDKSYSPASIAKAYLREMNIIPPKDKFQVTDDVLGIAMQGFSAGRAECHIRRTKVPVMRLDFLSQYPTTNTLMRNWDVLTAESVTFDEATEDIRKLLHRINRNACSNPKLWPEFRFFALVKPDRDIFPVRAAYDPRNPAKLNIGVNLLTSAKPIWFAGPDVVSSILLTGKVPHIVRAIRLSPHGKQKGMRPVNLLGRVRIDPNENDFFKNIIEQRKANESDKVLKHALKIIANSGSYGLFAELNEQHEYPPVKLAVFSGGHRHVQAARDIETPGAWYFPPLASLITSGGRLLLAMAEASVTEAGGTYLMADTDSLCVVASKRGGRVCGAIPTEVDDEIGTDKQEFANIPTLSHAQVKQISEQFSSLNPYNFPGTILKIEDINYVDSDPRKPFRTLFGFAISAKRYDLFEHVRGSLIIRDAKGHGLGYLMAPKVQNTDEDDWIKEAWGYVLQIEGIKVYGAEPKWMNCPAMMRIPVSSPAVLGRLKGFVKPFDFVLSPIVNDGWFCSDEDSEKPTLVTRFTKNTDEWISAQYFNVRNGEKCRITLRDIKKANIVPVRSYGQILTQYLHNPESKFLGPSGKPCTPWTRGVLQRAHIIAREQHYCGKEMRRKLEQGPIDHEVDYKCKVYSSGKVSADSEIIRKLAGLSEREIARGTGLHRKVIRTIRHGGQVRTSTFKRVLAYLRA
jgi:hypothetical protein